MNPRLRKLTRFSLRTALVVSTLAAIGLAFVGNRMMENRRQERLLEEVILAAEVEGAHISSEGFDDGTVQMNIGSRLSEATVAQMIQANRIRSFHFFGRGSPAVRKTLASEFHELNTSPNLKGSWWARKQVENAQPSEAWVRLPGRDRRAAPPP